MALLQGAESRLVANVPAGSVKSSVLIRKLRHTLYNLLAKPEIGTASTEPKRVRSPETLGGGKRIEDSGSKIRNVASRAAAGTGDNPAKFEEAWNAWEHQLDVYEKLATSKLDDDVKISVVLREAPTKLRDNLLVNSQQFESNYNKLRAIIQTYLNSSKSWTANE